MWGLAIESRPLERAARDLNCWAISAIVWVMFWFEFKIGLEAAERRHLAQDLLMNVQRGGGSRRQGNGWLRAFIAADSLQTNWESSCLTCWFLLLCPATTPISQLDCDKSQKQDRIGQLWPLGNDDHFHEVTRKIVWRTSQSQTCHGHCLLGCCQSGPQQSSEPITLENLPGDLVPSSDSRRMEHSRGAHRYTYTKHTCTYVNTHLEQREPLNFAVMPVLGCQLNHTWN